MESMVTLDDDGTTRTFVGVTVCTGPAIRRLMLTRPYHEAGHFVEIPNAKIESIETLPMRTLGDDAGRGQGQN